MFLQTTTSSRKGGKTYISYLVRESFRTPAGPRSRTVCNITGLPADTRDLIAASLKGQRFVATSELQLHEALDYGGLVFLNDAWSRFGLEELLADIGSPRQRGLLKAVIYSRLLFPCAKLSLAQKAQGIRDMTIFNMSFLVFLTQLALMGNSKIKNSKEWLAIIPVPEVGLVG